MKISLLIAKCSFSWKVASNHIISLLSNTNNILLRDISFYQVGCWCSSATAFVAGTTETDAGNESQEVKRQPNYESPEQEFGLTLLFFSSTVRYRRAVHIPQTASTDERGPGTIFDFLVGTLGLVFRNLGMRIVIFSS